MAHGQLETSNLPKKSFWVKSSILIIQLNMTSMTIVRLQPKLFYDKDSSSQCSGYAGLGMFSPTWVCIPGINETLI